MSAATAPYKRTRSLWKNARPSVLGGLVVALMWTVAAGAYWTAIGAGGGGGSVGTLAAPTIGSAAPGAGTVALSWTEVTPPGGWGPVYYYVTRNTGDPGGDCPKQTNQAQVQTCTDTGLSKGPYTYTVTAVWLSWTATSPEVHVILASGALDHFAVSAATTTPTAGQTDNLTITAQDAAGNTVTAYTGVQCLTFSGPGSSPNNTPPSYPPQGSCAAGQSAVTFANGVAAPAVTLYKAETVGLVVSDGSGHSNGAGLSLTVSAAGLNSFTIPTPATQTAGVPFSVSITAKDTYGNTATGYTGSQCIAFSGPANSPNGTAPTYPPRGSCAAGQSAVNFTSGVAAAVPITLYNPSTSTVLTATDAPSGKTGSTGAFTVNVGPVASFTIPTPPTQTAGVQFSVSITAKDAYGSTVTAYTGPQCLTFSGPGSSPNGTPPSYPAQGSCAAGQSAVTFTNGVAAAVPITLYNPSTSTVLTATDASSGKSGSTGPFTVNVGPIASFTIPTPATQTAGVPFSVSITAKDAYGSTVTSYTGSQCIAFSGPANSPDGTAPSYPAQGSCAAGQSAVTFTNGVAAAVPITLYNASSSTAITVTDPASGKSGSTGTFTVNAAGTARYSLTDPSGLPLGSQTAGTAFSVRLTAVDAYGNVTLGYSGAKTIAWSGPGNAPNGTPPLYPLTATSVTFASGVGTATGITLYKAETPTLQARDSGAPAITGTATFTVNPRTISSLRLAAATTTPTAGAADNLTITALDTYGNTASSYTGSHSLTFAGAGNAPNGTQPTVANSSGTPVPFGSSTAISFTAGVATVSSGSNGVMRLYLAGAANITVNEGGLYTSTVVAMTVGPGALNNFTIPTPTTRTAGVAFTVTLTAWDAYGNTKTDYTGSQCIVFSGPADSPNGTHPTYPAQGSSCGAGQSAVTFVNGVSNPNPSITLYNATPSTLFPTATTTLTATDAPTGKSGSTGTFNVNGTGVTTQFVILPATTTPVAGAADNLTIIIGDPYGNPVAYTGNYTLVFAGASNAPNGTRPTVTPRNSTTPINFGTNTSIAFVNGVATVDVQGRNGVMRLYAVETANITVRRSTTPNWLSNPVAVTVSAAAVSSLRLAAATTTPTAGQADNLTITALDTYGNTATIYIGSHNLTFAGANAIGSYNPTVTNSSGTAINFGNATAISFSAGVATVSGSNNGEMTLYRAETANITVAEGGSYTSNAVAITVGPGALNNFTIPTPTTRTAGTAFTVTLTAWDAYGNTKTNYTGSQCIVFSGPANSPDGHAPLYPAQGACGAGQSAVTFVNGVSNPAPSITLYNASTSTVITATDAPTGKSGSTGTFTVNGTGALTRFVIRPATTMPVAGVADNLTITMGDPYGNPVTTYTGSHDLTFAGANAIGTYNPTVTNSSGTAINFGSATAITFTAGVATVSGSNNGVMTLYRVETANVTVRQSTGTAYTSTAVAINVQPAAITTFTVATPGPQTAGTLFNVSISLTDTYGNGNVGTRCLTFSGPANAPDGTPPRYPAQGSCAAGQSEVNLTGAPTQVPITLYNAGATTLTVSDVTSGLSQTTGSFTVNPAAIDHFSMTAATTTPVAGVTDNLSITAIDPYGNTATGYTGAYNLSFSGAGSIRTYNPTVTNNAGTAIVFGGTTVITFTNGVSSAGGAMTLYKAETAHLVVSDGSHQGSLDVTVSPAALSVLSLSAEKVVVRPGAPDQLTIRAIDTYGNTAAGYGDGPHNITFAGGTGTRTVTNSAGSQIAFGTATSITFTSGISTAGGVMRINDVQVTNITATDGTYTSPALRIVVSSVSAIAVSAGAFHTCALRSDGAVECWGSDDSGQLGNGGAIPGTNSSNPVMVSGLTNATQISAGKYHTCAVRSDGTVWCWGLNDYGQLGNGSTTNSSTPVQVHGVGGTGFLTGVSQVSANGKFTCARISATQSVVCWGRNQSGQLGIGAADNNTHTTPAAVVGVGGGGTLAGVASITAGANHACALLSSGGVDCWGLNDHGQLGNNTTTDSASPVQVVGAGGSGTLSGVSEISGGRMHVCARIGGQVWCWGRNESGELGDGTNTSKSYPVRAGTIATAAQVSAGEYHSCARLADATAMCWGAAAYGQVGDGTTMDTPNPVTVIGPGGFGVLGGIGQLSAGGGDINETDDFEHTCALMSDGTVVCWGQNNYGQLGDGTTTMATFPVGVALL